LHLIRAGCKLIAPSGEDDRYFDLTNRILSSFVPSEMTCKTVSFWAPLTWVGGAGKDLSLSGELATKQVSGLPG